MVKPLFPEWSDLAERSHADAIERMSDDDPDATRRTREAPRAPRTRLELIALRARGLKP